MQCLLLISNSFSENFFSSNLFINPTIYLQIIHEAGPPHMRSFVTRCTVGDFKSEGEGNSKKLSKKRSAERMLEELKKLPPLPSAVVKPKLKRPVTKKKNRNLIKVPEVKTQLSNYECVEVMIWLLKEIL